MWRLIGFLWRLCFLRLGDRLPASSLDPSNIVTSQMSQLSLRERLDHPHPLPSLPSSLSPPVLSTLSITPPPSYKQRKQRRHHHSKKDSYLSLKEDRPLCQRCLPHHQETQDRLALLTKENSLKSSLQEFHYLVMRDGVQDAVEAMQWILLEKGIELEHNVLGCNNCCVEDGKFVYCSHSVCYGHHPLHHLMVEDHSSCEPPCDHDVL